jgi:hypothetical protein
VELLGRDLRERARQVKVAHADDDLLFQIEQLLQGDIKEIART